MVKPLADILAEIEERQSVRRFQAGGMGGDETPSDPGQDDTLGEEDEGPGPDISEEQSEPSATLIQAINDLYSLEDPVTREDTLSSLPPDSRNNIITGEESSEVLVGSRGDDTLGGDKEDGFLDGVNPLASLIESLISFFTLGAVDVQLDKGDLLGPDIGTGKTQPQGSVQLAVPAIGPVGTALQVLGPTVQLGGGVDPQVTLGAGRIADEALAMYDQGIGPYFSAKVDTLMSPLDSLSLAKTGEGVEQVQNLGGKRSGDTVIDDQEKEVGTAALTRDDIQSKQNQQVAQAPPSKSDTPPHNDFWGSEPYPDPSPASLLATQIVENAVVDPDKKEEEQVASWSFDPATWYPVAQGGPIAAFSPGGLAGMMNRGMMDNQLMAQQVPARPPQFGGIGLPRPSGFGFDPRPPSQQPRLKPETYYHEHEGGKVTYPNFPKPFVNPPDKPNNWKGGRQPIVTEPFQTLDTLNEEFTTPQLEEASRPEPYSPLEPVPPISISETTATAMEPEAVQEATQTTIEEARPVPREIDIQMPENVTATLDFPEDVTGTANYRRGGLAGILRSVAPMAAGWLLGPMGHIPAMLGGAGLQYGLAGKKRSFLDAIKGGLSGYAGSGIGRLGTAAAGKSSSDLAAMTGTGKESILSQDISALGATPKGMTGWESVKDMASKGTTDYWDKIGKQFSGLGSAVGAMDLDAYGNIAKELAGPLAAMIGQTAITTPAEMPEFTEVEIAQIQSMTPEQRRAYIEAQRAKYKDSPMMQPTVFAPPNVDIGWQPNYAAEGGVMEIDEEMESGSFVLPADVVSNVGDGSSDAGHRRLTELFGGSDEYALGGGTGILKGPVKGVGSGLDDLIQTGIDGVRVARLSSDEFVVPKDVVRRLGNGSQKAGSEKLYDFMKDVRLQKHGTSEQPKEIHMSGLRKMV